MIEQKASKILCTSTIQTSFSTLFLCPCPGFESIELAPRGGRWLGEPALGTESSRSGRMTPAEDPNPAASSCSSLSPTTASTKKGSKTATNRTTKRRTTERMKKRKGRYKTPPPFFSHQSYAWASCVATYQSSSMMFPSPVRMFSLPLPRCVTRHGCSSLSN